MYIHNIDPHIKLFKDLSLNKKTTIKDINIKSEIKDDSNKIIKEQKIQQIKEDIVKGNYKIDSHKVAEKILGY